MVLPRFRGISEGWTYDEDFKDNDTTTSIMLLEHRNLGRLSRGCVRGTGPIEIGQHIHNELAQWYFPLPGSEFIYTAGGEEVKMTGGDLSFTPTGFWHGSKVEAGRQCDYIWFEMCIDGYPGEIKYANSHCLKGLIYCKGECTMALVKISKGADIRHEYTDGVSRVPVLEGAYKDAAVERFSLQPGAELSPALYS